MHGKGEWVCVLVYVCACGGKEGGIAILTLAAKKKQKKTPAQFLSISEAPSLYLFICFCSVLFRSGQKTDGVRR